MLAAWASGLLYSFIAMPSCRPSSGAWECSAEVGRGWSTVQRLEHSAAQGCRPVAHTGVAGRWLTQGLQAGGSHRGCSVAEQVWRSKCGRGPPIVSKCTVEST